MACHLVRTAVNELHRADTPSTLPPPIHSNSIGMLITYFDRGLEWHDKRKIKERKIKEPWHIALRLFIFQASLYFAHFARLATHSLAKSRSSWPWPISCLATFSSIGTPPNSAPSSIC